MRLGGPAVLLLLLGFLKNTSIAQDITGVWTGTLYVDSTKAFLPYEMVLSEEKGKITGYSRIVFEHDGVKEVGIRDITASIVKGQVVIVDEEFVESNFSIYVPKRIKKTMVLDLTTTDTAMILKGTWSTNKTRIFLSATGSGTFVKKIDYRETAIFKRLEELKRTEKLSFTAPVAIPAAVAAVPSPPVAPPPPAPPVEDVPDLVIPRINNLAVIGKVPIIKTPAPSALRILPPTPQQRKRLSDLSKVSIRYTPPKPAIPTTPPAPPPVVTKSAPPVKTAPPAKPAPPPPRPTPPPPPVAKPAPTPAPKPVVAVPVATPVIKPSAEVGAADLASRTLKVEQTLYFENDSLSITLYDNGEVDGDTVTVVMNGGIVFSRQGLSTKANTKIVYIPRNTDSVQFIMYAENLGEIPPNTGLMVVMDGDKRYDLRFSADLKNSAAIIFRRRTQQE